MSSKSRRTIVVRGHRRYALCRLRPSTVSLAAPARLGRLFLLPGLTLLAVVLFSAYVIGRPPEVPPASERAAIASAPRYSFDDLANGLR